MRRVLALVLLGTGAVAMPGAAHAAEAAQAPTSYIAHSPARGSFPLVVGGRAAPIVVSAADYAGVVRVVGDLRDDVKRVTSVAPAVSTDTVPHADSVVVVGTVGKSPIIDNLVAAGKVDVSSLKGKWETSIEQVVDNPMPGVRRAFVIAGSDQRGTIYGSYDVSAQLGVSPWYWWDDVPARHSDALYVLAGRHTQGTPAVKYRGFFINDENPALGEWAPDVFGPGLAPGYPGGFNSKFFAKVFETMLRLKANYLWPAVWGRAFAEDDPANYATAAEYGVVMGTSHEAPMMRGIEEWNRHAVPAVRDAAGNIVTPGHDPYGGTGEWSYRNNAAAIRAYWTDGIRNMVDQNIDGVVTLGMRGNGDTGLPDGDGIDLMQTILNDERTILGQVTGKDVTTIPQVWTLYKEVQRYWDKGLRAPDDVTVVFTDDNWGNMRKLPDQTLPKRSGGYGMYYHFDYVGGGRDYKWVDTSNLPNIWDQLHNAYTSGVDRLWVFNVGDLKNDEMSLQFSLDYAWNPDALSTPDKISAWERGYAAQNFGPQAASAIADVLHTYAQLQSVRKPELLNRAITTDPATGAVTYDDQATPFSTANYRELDRATAAWQRLDARVEAVRRTIPAAWQDAFYELVFYEVHATANLYALRYAEFTNILYARQGRALTNDLAATTEARFADDQAMNTYYNTVLAGGKWKNFQTQPHIDYGDVARYGPNAPWQQPELNNVALPDVIFPAVQRISLPATADMGVAIDGSDSWWPNATGDAVLPTFSRYQSQPAQYVDVFDRGSTGFDYRVDTGVPWLRATPAVGHVDKQVRVTFSVDYRRAPAGTTRVPVKVNGPQGTVTVWAVVDNTPRSSVRGAFEEANGYVSIDADHFTRQSGWRVIPDIGRTGGGGVEPISLAGRQSPGGADPHLDYTVDLQTTGPVTIWAYLSPRNNPYPTDGLEYAVSVDGETPQIVNITTATGADSTAMNRQWERNTSDNVNRTSTTHVIAGKGVHTIRVWMVDPTVVVQQLIVDTGGLRPSYLGPPESTRG